MVAPCCLLSCCSEHIAETVEVNCTMHKKVRQQLVLFLTAGSIVEDLLSHAHRMAKNSNGSGKRTWRDEWRIFYTSKIMTAILSWDVNLMGYISQKCKVSSFLLHYVDKKEKNKKNI